MQKGMAYKAIPYIIYILRKRLLFEHSSLFTYS